MAIPYSLGIRMLQPGKPEMGNKTFPMAQYAEVLNLETLAEHMSSHNNKYNKGDIMAIATQLTSCIREQLLLGNRIILGDMGTFYISLISEGAKNAESFNIHMIKQIKVKWAPSTQFKNLINDASFTFVSSRKSQAEERKAECERLNALASDQSGTDNPGEDNGNGDSGLGD